jgi:hypothetical protein
MARAFLSATQFKVEINQAQLLKDISFKNQAATALEIRKFIAPKIEEAQRELIKDFNSHAVTREIKGGPNAGNVSNTLGGYGNLFSFIGFSSGDDPTSVIHEILSRKMTFKVRTVASGRFAITVYAPSQEEISSATPIPWASGSSWAEGVEKGISNLGSYLYSKTGFKNSSSGTGIQTKNGKRSVTFKGTPYISKIFNKFRNNLQNLDK